MKKIDIHSVDAKKIIENTIKVYYAFRIIIGGKKLSTIQEDFILCNLNDIPEELQEAFIYKCILEKHLFSIQIIPNTLRVENLSQKEKENLLNKI